MTLINDPDDQCVCGGAGSGDEELGSSEEEGKDWDELEAEAKRGEP